MRELGRSARERCATAWTRCVFPSPVPPQRNSGLWRGPPPPAAAIAAACASWFDGPTTKLLNVYFGFSPSMGAGGCEALPFVPAWPYPFERFEPFVCPPRTERGASASCGSPVPFDPSGAADVI